MEKDLGSLIPRIGTPSQERDDPTDGTHGNRRALAEKGGSGLAICAKRPDLSQPTAEALERFMRPHPQLGLEWDLVTPTVEAEAQKKQKLFEDRARPATMDEWLVFFRKVAMFTANAPVGTITKEAPFGIAFHGYVHQVATEFLKGCPAGALQDCLRACQAEEYFPKGEALDRIFKPVIAAIYAERTAIQHLARGNVLAKRLAKERAENPPPTEEQRAAVRERLAQAERVRLDAEKRERERMRENLKLLKDVTPSHADRVHAMRVELAGLDRAASNGGLTPSMAERRDQIRLRLTNIDRAERGEPYLTVKEWDDRRRPGQQGMRG